MAATSLFRAVLGTGVCVAVTGVGWALMKLTVPNKEEMLRRLPMDEKDPKKLAATEKKNQEFFRVLQEKMKSNEPVWRASGPHKENITRKS